jgi:hypothetical protein
MYEDDELTRPERALLDRVRRRVHEIGLTHGPHAAEEAARRVLAGAPCLHLSDAARAALERLVWDVEFVAAGERPSRPAA